MPIIENVKILVADDDPAVRDLLVTALSYCVNREVLSFENGSLVLAHLNQGHEADMIISDVEMPEMNGLDLLARVKKQRPGTVFIVMSGVEDFEKKARLAGADAFLGKPFELNDLFRIVQDFVVQEA